MAITTEDFAELLKTFIGSEGHELGWTQITYAVVQYTSNGETQYFIAKNRVGRHAEDDVIDHLKDQLEESKLDSQNVKIYISYSPCCQCSQNFLALLDHAKLTYNIDLKVEIVFAALYRIIRPSCTNSTKCTDHLSRLSKTAHENNVQGMMNLHSEGVRLRTFDEQDWLDLLKVLNHLTNKDELLKKDFELILELSPGVDQIESSSQCTTAMSLNPTQKSESDEPGNVSLDKQNEPDMRTTPEVCAGSDEEEKDGITARKRKREDESSEDERREKKLMKENERKEKGEYQEEKQVKAEEAIIHEQVTPEEVEVTPEEVEVTPEEVGVATQKVEEMC